MDDHNPYASPETDPTLPVPVDGDQLVMATRSARFTGALIDGLVGLALTIPLSFALQFVGLTGPLMELDEVQWMIHSAIHFPLYIAIQWKFLKSTGQTIGKKVAKTRIVTMKGEKPSMVDLVLKRDAFYTGIGMIPMVGEYLALADVLLIFRKDRRCIHDWVAGTRVVQVAPPAEGFVKRGMLD